MRPEALNLLWKHSIDLRAMPALLCGVTRLNCRFLFYSTHFIQSPIAAPFKKYHLRNRSFMFRKFTFE